MMDSMDGFEKMNLESKKDAPRMDAEVSWNESPKKRKSHKIRNTSMGLIVAFVIVGLLVLLGIVLPGIRLVAQAKTTLTQVRKVGDAAKMQNISLVSDELSKAQTEMKKTQDAISAMGYLNFIPGINFYYSDLRHMGNAGQYGLEAGRTLVDSVEPYADVLGLKGEKSFTGGTAEDRMRTAVTTFSKITPNLDKISVSISKMRKELDQINPNRYPSLFGGDKVKKQLADARTVVDQADEFTHQASPLIKVLPTLLGEPTEQKYLVLFQNDKEIRATGGFITAYAVLRFEHGVPHPDSSDDIYTLDATVTGKQPAPRLLQQYLPKVPLLNLRDTNLSPDFVVSMEEFNKLYTRAGSQKKVNGIIAIDTYPLLAAIEVLGGKITVDGQTFTTETDKRCNCPNVIYLLESFADQPVGFVKENRKGIIGDLMVEIMRQALSSSPKKVWGPLFQAVLTDIQQKHVLFYLYNETAQHGIEALNAAGRILPFDGDYLHVNEMNFGGAKSNMYVSEDVQVNYQIAGDGTITKVITINYKNPFPPSDCNLERGGLCLNAILRDVVRVYVPKGSELVSNQGSEVKMTTYDELGKTVFEGFVTVRPQGASKLTLTYKLPFKLKSGSPLPVMIQKQPGTEKIPYVLQINGRNVQEFPLLTDKTLELKP